MTSVDSEPWSSYKESYKKRFNIALAKADLNPYIRKWHANRVRKRVDVFVTRGLPAQFRYLNLKDEESLYTPTSVRQTLTLL